MIGEIAYAVLGGFILLGGLLLGSIGLMIALRMFWDAFWDVMFFDPDEGK